MLKVRRVKKNNIFVSALGDRLEDIINEIPVRIEHRTSVALLNIGPY
jgi:hypothetical protein